MRDHGRRSRNFIQISVMLGLLALAGSQLAYGPIGSTVVLTMPCPVQKWFAGAMLVGALFVLVGAVLPEPRAYWVECAGHLDCAGVLAIYTATLKGSSPSWTTSLGMVFAFIAVGCTLRAGRLSGLIVENFYPKVSARLRRRR